MIQPSAPHNLSGYDKETSLVKVEGKDLTGRKHDFRYIVPKENADEFASEIKKQNSKMKKQFLAKTLLGTIGSGAVGLFVAKKSGVILKTLSTLVFTAAGAVGSSMLASVSGNKAYIKFLNKYDAKEDYMLGTKMSASIPPAELKNEAADAQNTEA